jgi:hypothetical protein
MNDLLLLTPINCVVIAVSVIVHHECLILISRFLGMHREKARRKVLLGVFGTIIAHSIEVWIFAAAYYFLLASGRWGEIVGDFDGGIVDCVYLSFTCFTTVGFGDVVAVGHVRFLTVLEALTGLVLITWSASFLFLQMEKFWNSDQDDYGAKETVGNKQKKLPHQKSE